MSNSFKTVKMFFAAIAQAVAQTIQSAWDWFTNLVKLKVIIKKKPLLLSPASLVLLPAVIQAKQTIRKLRAECRDRGVKYLPNDTKKRLLFRLATA
jgi:hypothetical protein